MTSTAIKVSLAVLLSAGALAGAGLIGRFYLHSKRPAALQQPVEVKHYPHQHLLLSEWEQNDQLKTDTHVLAKGENLAQVATLRYGHRNFSHVIKVFNRIPDELRIKAGTKLRVPDMSVIMAEVGVTKVAPHEVELVLCARAKYDRVVSQLWQLRSDTLVDQSYIVPESIKRELLDAVDDLLQATEGLKRARPGVIHAPKSVIGQLESAAGLIDALVSVQSKDPNGYDIDEVQQHFGLALSYAIVWARDGFK
jgi:hypothetical protein